jgi:hypothetical protein
VSQGDLDMGIKGIVSCAPSPGLDSVDPIAVSSKRPVGGWTIARDNLLSSAPFRGQLPHLPAAIPPRISLSPALRAKFCRQYI